jgi:HSP20 family protein
MTTRGWDPLRDLLNLQERMNRLFEEGFAATRAESGVTSAAWTPPSDVYETAEEFVVQMDLPGVEPEDVELHVDGDRLMVRGLRRPSDKLRPESFHRAERSYGAFARSFRLGADVDPDRVAAHYRDGLLRIELPKVRRAWRARGERAEG